MLTTNDADILILNDRAQPPKAEPGDGAGPAAPQFGAVGKITPCLRGSHGESLPAAHAGCYLVSSSFAAASCLMPNNGLVASTIVSANFRWEVSSCSVKS